MIKSTMRLPIFRDGQIHMMRTSFLLKTMQALFKETIKKISLF
ncbi:MAG: hypothetical protein ACTSWY_09235 [Promethearchaeota archaeon]